jgi:hypothetical protein
MKGWETYTPFDPLGGANVDLVIEVGSFYQIQQSRCLVPPHLRRERDPVSETSRSLEYQTMGKVEKLGNPKNGMPIKFPCYILT